MRKVFMCSLIHHGCLGGALYLDEQALTYRTNKLTVDQKLRNLMLPLEEIDSVTWTRVIFPIAAIRMHNGETYRFLIFGQRTFVQYFEKCKGQQR